MRHYLPNLRGSLLSLLFISIGITSTAARAAEVAELWREGERIETFTSARAAVERALPGDTVRISPGVHFEHLELVGVAGTAGSPITIEGRPGARPVFEAAFEPLTVAPNSLWIEEPAVAPGVYSTPLPAPFWTAVYLASGERLFSHLELAALSARSGAYVDRDAGRLYVRLPEGAEGAEGAHPGDEPIFAAHRQDGREAALELIECSHLVVRGLDFRHGGYTTVRVEDSENVTLEDVVVRGGRAGLAIVGSSRKVLVTRSRVVGWHDPSWLWVDQKRNAHMESNGIVLTAGPANRIEYTEVAHWFNGINAKNKRHGDSPLRNRGLVLRYNHVFDIVDDGIELDGYLSAGRIYENRVERVFTGVSMSPRFAPNPADVLLFFRNTVRATKIVRFARGSSGETLLAEPKIFKLGSGRDPLRGGADVGPEGARIYQNDLFGTHYGIRSGFGSLPDVPPHDWHWINNTITALRGPTFVGTGLQEQGVYLDGNVYHQAGDAPMFQEWNGSPERFRSLAEARQVSSGWEIHGEQARLGEGRVDAGIALPEGLADSVVPDGAPDRGAFERTDQILVHGMLPKQGRLRGGERVVIRGRYFDDRTVVSLGGQRLIRETVISPNVITGFAPRAEAPGIAPLVVEKGAARIVRRRAYRYE